jgi:signal transduction histidine kinase
MSPRRRSEAGATAAPPPAVEREHIRRGFLGLALSHELKQPLHSLNLNIELLSKRLAKVKAEETADVAGPLGALGRVVDRINGCLDAFSARVTPDPIPGDPTSLTPMMEAAVERARDRAKRAQLELVLRVDDDVPEVPAHPEQIAVGLDALIDNAIRASTSGGEVTVAASYEDDDVRIDVIDHGVGMTPEVARRAVEIGFSTWGGTGIGLTVAKFIAYHHAGGFQVSSAPGKGTTASMILPASDVRE